MRHYAKQRGYSLSDHGIVSATKVGNKNIVRGTKNLFEATTEEDIFKAMGLDYVPPTMRNTEVQPVAGAGLLQLQHHEKGDQEYLEHAEE